MPIVRTFLDLSTSHLAQTTRDYLAAVDWATSGPPGGKTQHGWFIFADESAPIAGTDKPDPATRPDDYPVDLWACAAFARANGCEYLLFDADAAPEPALVLYEAGDDRDVHEGWSALDAHNAEVEGWNVFECGDGQLVIMASDDSPNNRLRVLNDQGYVTADHVVQRAAEGSLLHQRALAACRASLRGMERSEDGA